MNILIVGAGALGSYLGYILSKNAEVALVGEGEHITAIRKDGLRIVELATIDKDDDQNNSLDENPSDVSTIPAFDSIPSAYYDYILITTKAYDTMAAVESVLSSAQMGMLVLFQNGMGLEGRVSERLQRAGLPIPMARGLTAHGFRIVKPGTVVHTGTGRSHLGQTFGEGALGPLAELFDVGGLEVEYPEDIFPEIWIKGIVNSCINPVSALAGVENGELLNDEEALKTMNRLCREGVEVAGKLSKIGQLDVWDRVIEVCTLTEENRSSMLQDLDAGRPTEVDYLNGEIVKRGRELGVNVSMNRTVYEAVKAKEALKRCFDGDS